MFNHVMISFNDIERSKRFYNAVLGVLAAGQPMRNEASSGHVRLFYRHNKHARREPAINGEAVTAGNGCTVAFRWGSLDQIARFHDIAVANGSASIENLPSPRSSSLGRANLAYVRDLDGNKLCAIH